MSEPRRIDADLGKILAVIDAKKTGSPAPSEQKQPDIAPAPETTAHTSEPLKPTRLSSSQQAQAQAARRLAKRQGQGMDEPKPISYYTPELIQCTLPHSDPKTPIWVRKNGNFSLIVTSGGDENGAFFGVPYGSFPRLVLAHIITRVIATRQRRIELSSHFGSFLREVGYVGNYRTGTTGAKKIREQLYRLLTASIRFQYSEGDAESEGRRRSRQMQISPEFDLWWNFKAPEQDSLFGSWVEISEDLYEGIINNPVPLRTDVLKQLRKSPLAIDVYMWVSYRLFTMQATKQRERFVPVNSLQAQFGTGIAEENYRQFKSELKQAFTKVAALWHHGDGAKPEKSLLDYEFSDTGLFLRISPLLIGRGDRLTDQDEVAQIIANRQFDGDTLRKARMRAGKYDVYTLQDAYFQWLSDKNFTPHNPRAHFLDFVKEHCKRNG